MDATATPRGISLAVGELGARGRTCMDGWMGLGRATFFGIDSNWLLAWMGGTIACFSTVAFVLEDFFTSLSVKFSCTGKIPFRDELYTTFPGLGRDRAFSPLPQVVATGAYFGHDLTLHWFVHAFINAA